MGKRLVRTPKIYLRDSGLLHALLDLTHLDDVLSHPSAGASWEGFVIEQLIAAAGPQWQPLYFPSATGMEVDLVIERGGRVDTIMAIRRKTAPVASAGLHAAITTLKPKAAYVVHIGDATWPIPGGITAISVASLMKQLHRA